jgi:hypothetical protein
MRVYNNNKILIIKISHRYILQTVLINEHLVLYWKREVMTYSDPEKDRFWPILRRIPFSIRRHQIPGNVLLLWPISHLWLQASVPLTHIRDRFLPISHLLGWFPFFTLSPWVSWPPSWRASITKPIPELNTFQPWRWRLLACSTQMSVSPHKMTALQARIPHSQQSPPWKPQCSCKV